MKIVFKLAVPLILVGLGIYGLKALSSMKESPKKRGRPPSVKKVEVSAVHYGELTPSFTALGRVLSEQPVDLAAEVTGLVEKENFNLKEGQKFSAGSILVRLDSRRAELQFKSAISDLLNATARVLPEIQADLPEAFSKWKSFFDSISFASLPEMPEAKDSKEKLFLSRYNLYKLYFAAKSQKIALEKHILRAPFKGSVSHSNVRPGSTIGMGTLLATLVRTDKLELEIPLSSAEAEWVNKSEPVKFVESRTGMTVTGKVSRISGSVSRENQTVSLFVSLKPQDSGKLLDGMFGEARLIAHKLPTAFGLPRSAFSTGGVVHRVVDNKLYRVKVEALDIGQDTSFVTSGLEEGDLVVVETLRDVIDGMAVEPIEDWNKLPAPKSDGKGAWGKGDNSEKNNPKNKGSPEKSKKSPPPNAKTDKNNLEGGAEKANTPHAKTTSGESG